VQSTGFDVSWDSHNTPSVVLAGAHYTVDITLTNTGTLTWPAAGSNPVNLSYHWYRGACISSNLDTWDGDRTPLPADVSPGAQVTVAASLATPSTPGTYCLVWDIVQEQVVWFSWVSSNMLVVPVQAES
jgi:hypothetical protein